MIELESVSRAYGAKVAVENLTLQVRQGEIFAFLGANGAGKTTTIKMLVGLLRPDTGHLRVGPYDVVVEPRSAHQCVGYVPDQPYLYDKLTGREFLEFVAQIYGMATQEARASIEEQIERFALEAFVDQLSETYSHGMKQRVVFAAAVVHRPRVLVLDEPMVGLDPHSMRVVKDLLKSESRRGTTVLMSTHTLSLAEEIADRIGVIIAGRLEFVGTLEALRQRAQREDQSLEQIFLDLTVAGE